MILDWDIVQIEGALLETWLPIVFRRLGELAQQCGARMGSLGALIEDKNSGTILLQQALRRGMPAQAIDSKLTAMGKDVLDLGARCEDVLLFDLWSAAMGVYIIIRNWLSVSGPT